ncbi:MULTISPECIES: hypothetical protein [Hyphomicrobiales]|jgi:hypothetical protein|uniref:hypothetical protein n=2 Tax=Hyphomicrobiales TaxID=356 RepID=UPI00196AED1B|nr:MULTISPECIES: hypothetical protein [Hyphomicrobiales]
MRLACCRFSYAWLRQNARYGAYDTLTPALEPLHRSPTSMTLAADARKRDDWFDSRYRLALTEGERADLTAYPEAAGNADEPYRKFEGPGSVFHFAWKELTTFVCTLKKLFNGRRRDHLCLAGGPGGRFGAWPQIAPDIVRDTLFRFEMNLRESPSSASSVPAGSASTSKPMSAPSSKKRSPR